jgi:hypothetical protein
MASVPSIKQATSRIQQYLGKTTRPASYNTLENYYKRTTPQAALSFSQPVTPPWLYLFADNIWDDAVTWDDGLLFSDL